MRFSGDKIEKKEEDRWKLTWKGPRHLLRRAIQVKAAGMREREDALATLWHCVLSNGDLLVGT
jgi:hypothetical protein